MMLEKSLLNWEALGIVPMSETHGYIRMKDCALNIKSSWSTISIPLTAVAEAVVLAL